MSMGDERTIPEPDRPSMMAQGAGQVSLTDRYEIIEEIGRGGMGVVYKARQLDLDRIVAVKRILPEAGSFSTAARFSREKRTIAKLNHRNILTVFDAGEDEEGPWLSMEYIEGGRTLKDRVEEEGALPEDEVISIGKSLCSALSNAHRLGIIHRDVKPANVLIAEDGTLKLSDFGLAREGRSSDLSKTDSGMGTMAYAAPEQLEDAKNVDHRADIYGVGATLYHLSTGESPRVVKSDALPERLRAVLMKALSERPKDRYFSVEEMSNQLGGMAQRIPPLPAAAGIDTCPNPDCGAPTPEGEKYCESCGTGLYEKCPKCSNEIRVGKVFCGKCGLDLPGWREAEEHLTAAKEHEASFLWDAADAACLAALEAFPEHEAAHELLEKIGKVAATENRLWEKALSLVKDGDLEGAIKSYEAVLEINPHHVAGENLPRLRAALDAKNAEKASARAKAEKEERARAQALAERKERARVLIQGFTYQREQEFSCGGQTHSVNIYIHEKTELEFVLVPGGSFEMGSNSGDSEEKPVHRVTIKPFLICRTEVTQGIWEKIMGESPWSGEKYVREGQDYAAAYISWDDCNSFCKKTGLRMPTEAEWEYACRAGTSTKYCFGSSDSGLGNYAWYDDNADEVGEEYAHRVARKKANAFGLFDMHGNVWEWCSDKWHDNYNGAPTDGSSWESSGSSYRVFRGGCWSYFSGSCRSANRFRVDPGMRDFILGFRPALSYSH